MSTTSRIPGSQQPRPAKTILRSLPAPPKAQVILALTRPPTTGRLSVFLAGAITASRAGPDWRLPLIAGLQNYDFTFFNPLRPDWNSAWKEDISFKQFREQVEWEQEMQERADMLMVYFGPKTDAPISLLELGLSARSKKVVVACHNGYSKLGYVEIVSRRLGLDFFRVQSEDELLRGAQERLVKLLRTVPAVAAAPARR